MAWVSEKALDTCVFQARVLVFDSSPVLHYFNESGAALECELHWDHGRASCIIGRNAEEIVIHSHALLTHAVLKMVEVWEVVQSEKEFEVAGIFFECVDVLEGASGVGRFKRC